MRRVLLCVLVSAVSGLSAFAQFSSGDTSSSSGRTERVPVINRFAFRTNALEWMLTIPNAGVEFDLSSSELNRMTLGVTAKYNWNTYHRYAPSSVFNLFDVRPEFRYYYRTIQRPVYRYKTRKHIIKAATDEDGAVDSIALGKYEKEWEKYNESISDRSFSGWFKDEIWTVERRNPKPKRAQYLGVYADYNSFSLKFGRKGISGLAIGIGASYGYGVPLYEYNRGAVDMEFGFSVGLQVSKYDVFKHDPNGYYYTKIVPESRNFHLTPFPVISELKVAFVWRPESISGKYIKEDPQKKAYNDALADIDKSFKDMVGKFDESIAGNKKKYSGNDSLYRADYAVFVDGIRDDYKDRTIGMDIRLEDKNKEKLRKVVDSRCRKAMKEFNRHVRAAERAAKAENRAAEAVPGMEKPKPVKAEKTVQDESEQNVKVKKRKKKSEDEAELEDIL